MSEFNASPMVGHFARYLAWLAIFVVAFFLFVILLAVLVDPYRAFGTPTLAGVNEMKPRIYQKATLGKERQLLRVRPRTLLLGNSRVEIGLDPGSPDWPSTLQPVYNASQAGSGLGVALCRLQQALAAEVNLRLVVVGVDFQDFLVPATSPRGGIDEIDCDDPADWRNLLAATMTIDALSDSLITLIGQNSETGITMLPNGLNPLLDYNIQVQRIGHQGLFAQKRADNRKMLSTKPRSDFANPASIAPMRILRRLMRLAVEHEIEIVLFFHPYHAQYLDELRAMNLWESFQAWKRMVAHSVAAENRKCCGDPIRLFDFTGYYDGITTEPVPAAGDVETAMRWYWEAGHYKSALGDLILARLFGTSGSLSFGRELQDADVKAGVAGL